MQGSLWFGPPPAWHAEGGAEGGTPGDVTDLGPSLAWAYRQVEDTVLAPPLLALAPVDAATWHHAWATAGTGPGVVPGVSGASLGHGGEWPGGAPGATPDAESLRALLDREEALVAALSSPGMPLAARSHWPGLVEALAAAPPTPPSGGLGRADDWVRTPKVTVALPVGAHPLGPTVAHAVSTRGVAAALLRQPHVPPGVIERALGVPLFHGVMAWNYTPWSVAAARVLARAPEPLVAADARALALLRLTRVQDPDAGLPLPELLERLLGQAARAPGASGPVLEQALRELLTRQARALRPLLSRDRTAQLLASASRELRLAVLAARGTPARPGVRRRSLG